MEVEAYFLYLLSNSNDNVKERKSSKMGGSTVYSSHRVFLIRFAGLAVASAIFFALASGDPVQAQDENQRLGILNDSVSTTLNKTEEEFDARIYVRNASDTNADNLSKILEFSVVAHNSANNIIEPRITIENPGSLVPYSVVPVHLKILVDSEESAFSGYLVVSSKEAESNVEPGTVPFEMKRPIARGNEVQGWKWFSPFRGPSWMLLTPMPFAFLLVLVCYLGLPAGWSRLLWTRSQWRRLQPAPLQERLDVTPERDAKSGASVLTVERDAKSWASVLTVVAALVSALAGANVFPEERAIFTKEEVAGMSLFFGAIIIFAPVIYHLWRVVALYLVAAILILTAVWGQLLIALLYLVQIEGALPWWAKIALSGIVGLTTLFVGVYAWRQIRTEVNATIPVAGTPH